MPEPVSYDGHDINDGSDYVAHLIEGDYGLPGVSASLVERANRWPLVSGIRRPGAHKTVRIFVEDSSNVTALRAALMRWFDPEDETPKALVVNSNGRDQYVMVICQALDHDRGGNGRIFVATLPIHGDVRWRKTTATEQTWAITATGQTVVVANAGQDDAYPVLRVKPTSAKTGGYAYRRQIFVRWRVDEAVSRYPVDLTNDSLDTAALIADTSRSVQVNQVGGIDNSVTTIPYDTETGTFPSSGLAYVDSEQISYTGKTATDLTGVTRGVNGTSAASHADNAVIKASKMMANGHDFRALVNGVEVDLYVAGMNTTTTQGWVNLDFERKVELTTTAAIAGSGSVDTIDFNESIERLPAAGAVVIDSEAFAFTGKNNALKRVTGVTRASLGTSMASHSSGATAWWMQHNIQLLYGNPSASAPMPPDDHAPIFSYGAGATNTSWVYGAFGDAAAEDGTLRPGSWYRQLQPASAQMYTANQGLFAEPWSEIGIELGYFAKARDTARWAMFNPCGITNANFTNGQKYVETKPTSEWQAEIQSYSDVSDDWVTEYSIPSPSTPDTWEAWSQSQALDSGARYVGLMLKVPDFNGEVDKRMVESADCTLTLNSSNTPAITIGSEEGNYSLACTITNNTTGDAIELDFVMDTDQELEVDTDAKTVTYLKDDSSQFQALTVTGGARRDWLSLQPGNNTLQFDDTGTVGVTVTIIWRERYYD